MVRDQVEIDASFVSFPLAEIEAAARKSARAAPTAPGTAKPIEV